VNAATGLGEDHHEGGRLGCRFVLDDGEGERRDVANQESELLGVGHRGHPSRELRPECLQQVGGDDQFGGLALCDHVLVEQPDVAGVVEGREDCPVPPRVGEGVVELFEGFVGDRPVGQPGLAARDGLPWEGRVERERGDHVLGSEDVRQAGLEGLEMVECEAADNRRADLRPAPLDEVHRLEFADAAVECRPGKVEFVDELLFDDGPVTESSEQFVPLREHVEFVRTTPARGHRVPLLAMYH